MKIENLEDNELIFLKSLLAEHWVSIIEKSGESEIEKLKLVQQNMKKLTLNKTSVLKGKL